MFRYLFSLSIAVISTQAVSCDFIDKLDPYQKQIAKLSYQVGEPHDLGLTMVAVAWEESRLGLFKVRMSTDYRDQSFGTMHTVAKWKTKGMTPFERGIWVQNIVENELFSLQTGLSDLLYWYGRKKNWADMVGSYNGGNTPNPNYLKRVRSTVRNIKSCTFD